MKGTYVNLSIAFKDWLTVKGYKPRGIEEKMRAAHYFLAHASGNGIDIATIGVRGADAYREHLRLLRGMNGKPRYNPKTINLNISYLTLFYQYLLERGSAVKNFFSEIDRMKESELVPRNVLTIEEMGRLLENLPLADADDVKLKVLVELLYATGARISEIESLKVEDVNFESGYIVIHDDKDRQDRRCPLTEYARDMLQVYVNALQIAVNERIFPHGKSRSLNRWINDRLKRITQGLELPLVTCHSIRHTIATHLLKCGADIREVQEFLGHRRIKNTEVYTRIFPDDLREVLEQSHPRERHLQERSESHDGTNHH